ncbi:hypothetical protein RN001_010108 [Aquatica leii]|uniref:Uncharacterized protein n=1 Tax=Aquatica leii TaxID=1421715 RepID=A0AAN7P637_9COLE|nr:hypothetical protein RN001_010108 [Aquatica leii]
MVFGRLNLAGDHQETRIFVTDSVDADDSVVSNSDGLPIAMLQNPNEVGEASTFKSREKENSGVKETRKPLTILTDTSDERRCPVRDRKQFFTIIALETPEEEV